MKLNADGRELDIQDAHVNVIVSVLISKMTHQAGIKDEYARYISYSTQGKVRITSIQHSMLNKMMFNHFSSFLLDNDLVIGTQMYTNFLSELAGAISKHKVFVKYLKGFNYFKNHKQSKTSTEQILQHYKEKYK